MSTEYPSTSMNTAKKEMLPHSIAALVVSIVSLSTMALFGWIPGIIALRKANEALDTARENPGRYSDVSISMANAGRRMGIIGIVLGLAGIFVWVLYFLFIFFIVTMATRSGGCCYY